MLNGTKPADPTSRAAPTVNIHDIVSAFAHLEKRASLKTYTDPDFQGLDVQEDNALLPDTTAIESMLSSLIDQGLLGGFISHEKKKFAITGTKSKGSILAAGFPQPWGVLKAKAEKDKEPRSQEIEVPGWKKQDARPGGGVGGSQAGPGMVLNSSGLRPIGAAG